jgi:hypothetical protein
MHALNVEISDDHPSWHVSGQYETQLGFIWPLLSGEAVVTPSKARARPRWHFKSSEDRLAIALDDLGFILVTRAPEAMVRATGWWALSSTNA